MATLVRRFSTSSRLSSLPLTELKIHHADHVVTVTLNRPGVMNAVGKTLATEFLQLTKLLQANQEGDNDVRAVVLTGAGEGFSTGRDLKESRAHSKEEARAFMQLVMDCSREWQRIPIPTIAAVNGHCYGWGLEVALASDIRLAYDHATFCLPECGLGIFPGAGGTVNLARLVGPGIAKELIFSSRKFNGLEAVIFGVANHSYPSVPELARQAADLAAKIASNGPLGVRAAKVVIDQTLDHTLDEALEISNQHRFPLNYTKDFQEALQAFKEKRKPKFTGK